MVAEESHIIVALVEDKPGVMFRISSLIRRRGFNIDSIAVGRTEHEGLSRITMTMRGDKKIVEQLIKQLAKIVEVIKISELKEDEAVVRELALVKVHALDHAARSDIIQYANIFRARIVDVARDSLTIEIVGAPSKIDAFVNLMRGYGLEEIAKTGIVAVSRGPKAIKPKT